MLFLILLSAFLSGAAGCLVTIVCSVVSMVRNRRRGPAGWLKAGALLAFGAAIGMYTWGLAYVGTAVLEAEDGGTESSPLIPCRGEADHAIVERVIDYKVGWVPLRFECHLLGGGSYVTSSVPGYVNPVVALLGVAGVACIVSSAVIAERAAPRPDAEPGRVP